MSTYTIPALEWTAFDTGYDAGETCNDPLLGTLRVSRVIDAEDSDPDDETPWKFSYCVAEYYDEGYERFATKEEAKVRAAEWRLGRLTSALTPVAVWQSIETAPKDGQRIMLAYNNNYVSFGSYDNDQYAKHPTPHWKCDAHWWGVREMKARQPTHWMPLPEPPQEPTK